MFSGIVHSQGRVLERSDIEGGLRLKIATELGALVAGESIAIDGACLTATCDSRGELAVDVSAETLDKTTLGRLQAGDLVNLERALRLGDSIGGHWVTGHVDAVGQVRSTESLGGFLKVDFSGVSGAMARWLIPKGSVTVNGVSLTLNQVYADGFSVMLIPHTLERTGLKDLEPGSKVNLEFDWMVKTVLRDLNQRITWMEEADAELRSH